VKNPDILSNDYSDRIHEILDISWRILKTRFIEGRHEFLLEAPFQHYFAHIISSIGDSFCTKREDQFLVDLETKLDDIKGKTKYVDITCSFPNQKTKCAIELKFKTQRQGAQDHGRIDAFRDIEVIELACNQEYNLGRFYMITNSTPYINQSRRGVGTVFTTHDGAITEAGQIFHCPDSKGREDVIVKFRNPYTFNWEKINDWYFLELKIQ